MSKEYKTVTYRFSSVSKKQPAPKGNKWMEFMYNGGVIKAIPVPSNISGEQIISLLDLVKKEVRLAEEGGNREASTD